MQSFVSRFSEFGYTYKLRTSDSFTTYTQGQTLFVVPPEMDKNVVTVYATEAGSDDFPFTPGCLEVCYMSTQ